MNKQKKPHVKPGTIIGEYRIGEFTGPPEMIEEIKAAAMNPSEIQKCPYEDMEFD